ncbi:MAG: hypothetical protein CL521_03225 [Actinobacteria bacterium]|nr:hypothetical protein [Actinomycetota bacterium]|tara:strand:+ start:79 stop:813 length:735 start_codon:yes stop_codon:yes gene_type:complete
MIRFLILGLCAFLSSPVYSQSLPAEQAYKNQAYEEALSGFLAERSEVSPSWQLAYNIGNTYYQLGQLGLAIGWYRRAQNAAPRDTDIAYNLTLAREQVSDQIPEKDLLFSHRLGDLVSAFSFNEGLFFWLVWLLGLNMIGTLILLGRRVELMKNLIAVMLVLGLFITGAVALKYYQQEWHENAVIIADKVSVMSGPSSVLSTLFYVHEGIECRLLSVKEGWIKIELNNGFKGWVQSDTLFNINR